MKLDELTDLMDELSKRTWFNLTEARALKMRMGEVTLTEMNLLAIAQLVERTKLNVELVATRKSEATTGTDFEIWLRTSSGKLFGYSIQAKVIRVRGKEFEYPELGHSNDHGVQIDLLERRARRVGSYPIHLFFNGWERPNADAPSFPGGRNAELFGCAAVQTSVVRTTRGAIGKRKGVNKAGPYAAKSMPWSDLFRVSTPGKSSGGSSQDDGGMPGSIVVPSGDGSGGGLAILVDDLNPTRAINLTASDFRELGNRLRRLGGEGFESAQADQLPNDIEAARGKSIDQIEEPEAGSDTPHFALIIDA